MLGSSPNLTIITFASDHRWAVLAQRLINDIRLIYPTASTFIYRSHHLPKWIKAYANEYKRGYGYWIWKPYVIKKALHRMPPRSVLLYLDARFLVVRKQRVEWLDTFLNSSTSDILAWQLSYRECEWTTADLFSFFRSEPCSHSGQTGQFAGTMLLLRNNPKSLHFVDGWLSVLDNFRYLCRDDQSLALNHSDFIENRHDQSVLSLMLKTSTPLVIIDVLPDQVIKSSPLCPQGQERPSLPKPLLSTLLKVCRTGLRRVLRLFRLYKLNR